MAILKLHKRKLTIEEVKAITDPAEHTLAAAEYFGMPPMSVPGSYLPEGALLCDRGVDFWTKAKAVPMCRVAGRMMVAFADPFDLPVREEIERICGGRIWSTVAPETEVLDALARAKAREDAANPALAMENIMKGQEADIEVSSIDSAKESDTIDATSFRAPRNECRTPWS